MVKKIIFLASTLSFILLTITFFFLLNSLGPNCLKNGLKNGFEGNLASDQYGTPMNVIFSGWMQDIINLTIHPVRNLIILLLLICIIGLFLKKFLKVSTKNLILFLFILGMSIMLIVFILKIFEYKILYC